MASDRLTRQELSWLLAQQARSAADTLRRGVTSLAVPKPESPTFPAAEEVTSTLDALDDAMRTLTSLHTGGPSHGRRGRIDLAALLLDLAPGARVDIAPGSGTEVFGDEVELRRMLQVLVSLGVSSAGGSSETGALANVRRSGDVIRVTVPLGPDSSVSARMEHAWLHRMATRHGGKIELGAGELVLELPGDTNDKKKEMDGLRRELAAAQEQGEAYARELASMFARTDTSMPPPALLGFEADDGFVPLLRFARQLAAHLRPEVVTLGKAVSDPALQARAAMVAAWLGSLARFGDLDINEALSPVEPAEAIRPSQEIERLADARGVALAITPPARVVSVKRKTAAALVSFLLTHAIEATPRGGTVRVSALAADDGLTVTVEDGGSRIPIAARGALLGLEGDPTSVGRPPGVELFLADALVRHHHGALRLEDAALGARFEAFLPSR